MTDGYTHKREAWEDEAEAFSRRYVTVCNCGGAGYVRTNAPIGHRLFGKPIPCVCKRDARARSDAARLRKLSGISDTELSSWTFEAFRPIACCAREGQNVKTVRDAMAGIKRVCEEYAAKPQGWLVLSGPPGTGKTHLAYAIAAQQLALGRPVYAHTTPEMLDVLRSSVADGCYETVYNTVQGVELLVLDDLGAQRGTDWADQTLYEILNHRYARRMPLVVTTNCDLRQSGMDERLISRLLEGSQVSGGWSRVVALPCSDYRPRARWKAEAA